MSDLQMLDGLQQAVIESEKNKSKNNKYQFDHLAMLFMEDYTVKGITISQPTIGDMLRFGEENFYHALSPFLYNSTSIRLPLWEAGIDWCTIKDIEVFSLLNNVNKNGNDESIQNKEILKTVFKNYDFSRFESYKIRQTPDSEEELCLYDKETDMILYEDDYMEIAEYIREMMNYHPKVEKAKGKTAKKWMIDEDRMNAAIRQNKEKSNLLSLVSACVNHPGFKYKLQELREVGIYQFMDSVQRLQIYESSSALLQGRYAGFCDLSKVPDDNFNFMREAK